MDWHFSTNYRMKLNKNEFFALNRTQKEKKYFFFNSIEDNWIQLRNRQWMREREDSETACFVDKKLLIIFLSTKSNLMM